MLQAERSEQYNIPFSGTAATQIIDQDSIASGTGLVAYNEDNDTAKPVYYEKVLKDNGISFRAGEELTTITWEGGSGTTLTGFVFKNATYTVTYNNVTGFDVQP